MFAANVKIKNIKIKEINKLRFAYTAVLYNFKYSFFFSSSSLYLFTNCLKALYEKYKLQNPPLLCFFKIETIS